MKRYCFALDLPDDPVLIAEYEDWHTRVPEEIQKSMTDAGIVGLEIYRVGNRMIMMFDTTDAFDVEEKARMDAANPAVQKWEQLMWKYQKPLPFARPGEKWMLMKRIYKLETH